MQRSIGRRYTGVAQALHWLTAPFVLAVLALAWIAEALPEHGPDRAAVFTLHKSVGITILVLIAARLIWRARHPAPALGTVGAPLRLAAKLSHGLLYFVFLAMPVSGYLFSANGKPLSYFGLFDLPGIPASKPVHDIAHNLHLAGQWAVYALVVLHVLATAWHTAVRRDGILDRMLPPQDRAGV